LSLYSNVLEIN